MGAAAKGGAALLLTGLWLGEAGIARPRLGTFPRDCWRWPGIGGRSIGAGEDMSKRDGGSTAPGGRRSWSCCAATVGCDVGVLAVVCAAY